MDPHSWEDFGTTADPTYREGRGAGPGAPDAVAPKRRLGRYLLLEELGRGGQGVVFLAQDERLDRRVALKVLSGWGLTSKEAQVRFRREAEVACRLSHPGICTVYEAGVEDGLPFIAMQYVEGETLSRDIRTRWGRENVSETPSDSSVLGRGTTARERRVVSDILSLVEQVARALHDAHEAGVIHRDIKPGNIMVTPRGNVVIMDFGLAREMESDVTALTRTGEVFGTPAYMAPEQLSGVRLGIDRRTDVWALGVTLYECLTLRRPFDQPTREATYHAILHRDPPDPRTWNPSLSKDLRVVLFTALEKDRDRRYQTSKDLGEDLRRILESKPIHARPVRRIVRLQRWAARNPVVASSLVLALIALTVALIISLRALDRTRRAGVEREGAFREKSQALEDQQRALARFLQMSDAHVAKGLLAEERDLWPCRPDRLPKMRRWSERARSLLERKPLHRNSLEELRAQASPLVGDEHAVDLARRRERYKALFSELQDQERQSRELESRREGLSGPRRDRIEETLNEVRVRMSELAGDPRLKERCYWTFQAPEDAWRHEVLTALWADLEPLSRLVVDVDARMERTKEIVRLSLDAERERWNEARSDILTSGLYGGLVLEPQLGLVPLGRDGRSGLWEFWVFESGEKPTWEGATLGGKLQIQDSSGIVLVLVPGGRLNLGLREADGRPAGFLPVSLDPFFISKFEMTCAQWHRAHPTAPPFVPRAGRFDITARNPIEKVDWHASAHALLRWGLGLPSEAQWEYAARAGTETPWYTGANAESLTGAANLADRSARAAGMPWPCEDLFDDGYVIHAPVGTFAPNAFGLHDVLGNVWEWCADGARDPATKARPGDGRRDDSDGEVKARRGGGFYDPSKDATALIRFLLPPSQHDRVLGLRPARSLDR